jgi:hypothetical protein
LLSFSCSFVCPSLPTTLLLCEILPDSTSIHYPCPIFDVTD